ncbi:MAG: GGDEF domain-containing protein [Pseudomonadota bacterium]|nr:GGDEF domain-containing protein [Pseudomonadota bacterium]
MGFSLEKLKNQLQLLFVDQELLEDYPYDAFRQLLSAALMVIMASVLLGFVVLHAFVTELYFNVIVNGIGVVMTLSLLYRLHQTKSMGLIGHTMTVVIISYFPVFTYLNQAQAYSLIWVFFVPFVIIAFVGRKTAFVYLAIFFAILFSMTFWGIDHWDNKEWNELSFLRFVAGSILGVLLALVMDIANTDLNKRIHLQRLKERRYNKELRRLSTVDALTQVYNRHYFKEVFENKVREFKDTELYLTFFILDIDHFKLYNDEFGHQQGDEVLQKVAKAIHTYIKRQDDLVFRLGGEEFGGLLITSDPKETSSWVAQLKNEIEALKIAHASGAPEKYLTISIGVFSVKVKNLETVTCLYRVADKALYKAKHQGRNQAVIVDADQYPQGCA